MMSSFGKHYQRRAMVPKREAYNSGYFNWFDVGRGPHRYFAVPDDEFWKLYDSGVMWDWNERYGTMLDEFEEGFYECDLDSMLEEVVGSIGEGAISESIRTAISEGTGVCFIF